MLNMASPPLDGVDSEDVVIFKKLVDKFLESLFSNHTATTGAQGTELLQVLEYLKFDYARMVFGRELLNTQNVCQRKSTKCQLLLPFKPNILHAISQILLLGS